MRSEVDSLGLHAAIEALRGLVRTVPDFPSPGIQFRDLTPLLADPGAFELILRGLEESCHASRPDVIVAIEARGFIFGAPLASRLQVPFVPVRKAGKLPSQVRKVSYALEYGTAELEVHTDALARGARALIVDDVLATGGTALAAAELVQSLGGRVSGVCCVIELVGLKGRERLQAGELREVASLLRY